MKQKLIQVTIKFAKLKNEGTESLKLESKPVQSVINCFQNRILQSDGYVQSRI